MAPSPQINAPASVEDVVHPRSGNQVVISGMSGLYPRARYIRDLDNILYNKINPITSEDLRWKYNHPESAQFTGKVPDLDRFDAQFFKVHFRLGNSMDSMARKILEQAYEAIYDAGICPDNLSGKKVGVYIGTCFSETEKACFYVATSRTGFGIAGCSKTMFANRISYWLNAKGPSLSIDDACCSSTAALEQAYLAITRSECEAAIVGGANICLHPQSSVHYERIMNLSRDGKTKSFDQNASGCAKSEAINVLFLQKAKDACRIYADVVHVKCEYLKIPDGETGPMYGFYRDPEDTAQFLKTFYDSVGIAPNLVEYVEGCGSAVLEADKSELEAFDKIFCSKRDEPLMVGSVMSNIGYGEAASGISAITKVLLGYHRGKLAGNLNYETPRSDVPAIKEGRIQILKDHQRFRRTYAAVNSMSVTGVNAHVLLHGHYKPKNLDRYSSNIPYLITMSGRQDSSVKRAFEQLKSRPIDPEQLALLQNIHQTRIAGHLGRGYAILDTKDSKTVSLSEQVDYFDDAQRPLWFVYSGMGSQWSGMGTQLMQLPIFAAAIERCRQILEPKGLDIVHIITSPDKTIFDNILNSFVGIAAVQIGLTDVLRELGLIPDKIIGHSVGELGCAYADGCLTAEEMILSAYSRGLVSLETPFIKGSMAAVGLGFRDVSKLCPPEIEIACHNSAESCTISGPADAMRIFVGGLVAKGIFAKEVPCSNIAYHSRYIAKAGPRLLKYLKDVIKTPKARSDKWVSTSVPQDRWEEEVAKFSSAEYHTNNLLSPVLFEETSTLIPSNAVLVEIAPHGLLQAILKRSLPENCTNIPLTRRGHPDSLRMVLEAVGKLYIEGYNPKVHVLYPRVEFPVSTGTPFLSDLVDWAHHEKWTLPLYVSAHRIVAAACKFVISVHDDEHSYLKGHVIKKKTQLPFSYALVAAWDTLAMTQKVQKKQINVVFSDVHFHAQPMLHDQQNMKLAVSLHRGSGRFEIMDGNFKVASGFINSGGNPNLKSDVQNAKKDDSNLNSGDVYQLFFEREYSYGGQFRSIHSANNTLTEANIIWNDNWVTFIDGMLQLNALKHPHNGVSVPSQIRRIAIDVTDHLTRIISKNDVAILKANVSIVNDYTRCGGVLIESLKFHDLPPSKEKQVDFKTLRIVPRFQSNIDTHTSLLIFMQIVSENVNKEIIKVVGVESQLNNIELFSEMRHIATAHIPGIKIEYQTVIKNAITQASENIIMEADLVLFQNLSNDDQIVRILQRSSRNDVFVVNQDALDTNMDIKIAGTLKTVSVVTNNNTLTRLELVRFQHTVPAVSTTSVVVRSEKDLPSLMAARNKLSSQNNLIILTTYPSFTGLKSLVKLWRKDSSRNNINLIMINDGEDTKQLAKLPGDLAYNILHNDVWCGEYFLPLKETPVTDTKIILQSENIGNLSSLKWVKAPQPTEAGILLKVHYAGINMNDVLRASGVIPMKNWDLGFGMDFSGVTSSGERVMGLVPAGAAQSHVIAQPEFMWPVPSHWNLEDAATVPLAYIYAYYCLYIKLTKVMKYTIVSVLIHGGAGALGQAMISVSLAKGYRVFTTVSNLQKKKLLLSLFPELRDEDIGNSRDSSFEDLILSSTEGKGCHIVVCCLKGELKNSSLKCSAPNGQTFDTVQIHNQEIFNFGMKHLTMKRTYRTVDISSLFLKPNADEVKQLQVLVSEGIASGAVRPLSRVTYAIQDVSRAFRLLAASQHRGRVLLRLHGQHPPAQPRLCCSEDGSHILFCDAQPIGLQLADMLIGLGAKKIYLHFKVLPTHLRYKQSLWNKQNVEVFISSEDLNSETGITSFLHKAMTSGPIHGVYVAADYLLRDKMLTTLDMVIRKSCSSLKYFLTFSNGDDSGQFIAIKRAKDGLPATVVNLSTLETVEDEGGLIWYKCIKEVSEQALLSSQTVLLSQLKNLPEKSLFQQIASLTDIDLSEEVNSRATLEELGIPLERFQGISTFLRDEHNISIDEAALPFLSVESIKQIEARIVDTTFVAVKGLQTFFSYVDPDELQATTDMMFLPTLTTNSTMRDDELDLKQSYMCIVPGLEGHHERFRGLCERLKLPALVLQPGLDHLQETVEELALRYSKVLLKKAGLKNSFYLLGYETGVLVSLELAAILEKHGTTGTVFCIGDGPEEIKSLMKEQLREYKNKEALQIGLVQHMFTLMTGESASSMENIEGMTWRQQVDTCVRTLLGHVSHSAQYARSLIEAAYAKIATTISYNAVPKVLKSNIVVLRALSPDSASAVPCSLQHYSQQPIRVYNLTTPLAHVAKDTRCASIINKHLSEDILEAYDNKNLCESYLLNAETFMTTS